jgi:flavodoxin I
MKALVVYDTVFGNTEKIAHAMGDALGSEASVEVLRVGNVKLEQLTAAELLLVGSPTRGFRPTPAISRLVKAIPREGLAAVKIAGFDTRFSINDTKSAVRKALVRMFGYAADPIANRLAQRGAAQIIAPEGFFVADTKGPLKDGELERAADWAKRIAEAT